MHAQFNITRYPAARPLAAEIDCRFDAQEIQFVIGAYGKVPNRFGIIHVHDLLRAGAA